MRDLIVWVVGVCVLTLAGPVVLPAQATLVDSNSIIQDGIEYYMQTDKSVYDLSENVEMLYRVTNLGDDVVTFEFAYQQQCSFEVWDAETRVWGWPKYVEPAGSYFTLEPGEFREYIKDWDMMNDNGTASPEDDFLITTGIYDVTAVLLHETHIPVSVPIEIIPEPASLLLLGLGAIGVRLS